MKNTNQFKDSEGNWLLNTRSYFDMYSHEFRSSSVEQKINNLAMLIDEGMDLPEIIMKYCDNHNSYIIDAVKPTLLCYLQLLRWGDPLHFTSSLLEDLSEVEIAMLLQDELSIRYSNSMVCFSNWDDSVFAQIIVLAENDNERIRGILTKADFTREFIYSNTDEKGF